MLTDAAIRKAKPGEKPIKLADSGGLVLFISPSGGKLWRFRYRVDGKQKDLSLGAYPGVSLVEARQARDEAKIELREGRDPGHSKKAAKAVAKVSRGTTFETIAREWHELQKPGWVERHAWDVLNSMERDVFPSLGNHPIADIDEPMILETLREIEGRGAKETARRLRQRMSAVFVFAISTGRGTRDPAAPLKLAMAPMKKGRFPAVTTIEDARKIIEAVDAQHAHPVTKLAMRLLAITAVRVGSLLEAPWSEFPAGADVWNIPAGRMKLKLDHKDDDRKDHPVPLPVQARETIEALRTLSGRGPLVLPNTRFAHKPMSENALGYLLHRSGYHGRHVPHGWRSTFSSVMNELQPENHRIIDAMLAHTPKDRVEAAYNRATHMAKRAAIAQTWADLLMKDQMPLADLLKLPRR